MSWARVDDQWWSHPKVLGLSLEARGLWVTALSWSCGQRKSRVPGSFVSMLGGWDHVGELVDAGLWVDDDDGFLIHDWAEYQDRPLSEKRAEAGRKGAEKRWQKDSKPEAKTDPDQGEQEEGSDGKPIANPVAKDGKADGRYPSHPIPSHPDPSLSSPNGDMGTLVLDEDKSDQKTGLQVWVNPDDGKVVRRVDALWDSACQIWGDPQTKTERGRRNRELGELRDAGVSPDELTALFVKARSQWPDAAKPSPAAIVRHLGDLRMGQNVTNEQLERAEMQAKWDREEERARERDAQQRGLGAGR